MADSSSSRISVFVETPSGFKGYVEVHIQDLGPVTPEFPDDTPLDRLYMELGRLDTWLDANGYKRDTSFDKPARGGGGGGGGFSPPPTAPAPDANVPMHCGQACEFQPERISQAGRRVPAKYQCAKKNACPDKATTGWPFSIFQDQWQKKQGG